MASKDRTTLTAARTALDTARQNLVDALYDADKAAAELEDAERRLSGGDLASFVTAKNDADSALQTARTALSDPTLGSNGLPKGAEPRLAAALSAWLQGATGVADDVTRMEGNVPILFFPVRVQTRFETRVVNNVQQRFLKIRVYPDEILINSHETALTPEEEDAGQKYYHSAIDQEEGEKLEDWRELVRRFGAERAAYILRALTPHISDETGELTFPEVPHRPSSWSRPAEAILPDRWTVVTWIGQNRRIWPPGKAISEPLAITLDPGSPASQQTLISNNAYSIDDKILWTIDFQRALDVGMALELGPLSTTEALGFDRLIVFGVKTSLAAVDTSEALERLVDAHHYTRGFAFVRQGTPTNNTKDRPTPYPEEDKTAAKSFARERQPPPPEFLQTGFSDSTVDGERMAILLGVRPGVFANVDRAREKEGVRASAMNVALWPVSVGAFMKFMMQPIFTDADIQRGKGYFRDWVAGRGLVPAIRVGGVPYGVLPVTSINRWKPRANLGKADDITVEAGLLGPLKVLLPAWKTASTGVNRLLPQSQSADLDWSMVLSLFPSSREARIRVGIGDVPINTGARLLGVDSRGIYDRLDQLTADMVRRIGHPEWKPRIGRMMFLRDVFVAASPFVLPRKQLSETAGLAKDYLSGLQGATLAQLVNSTVLGRPDEMSLLYELMRVSTLNQYCFAVDRVLRTVLGYTAWTNQEIWGLSISLTQSIIDRVLDPDNQNAMAIDVDVKDHLKALGTLAGVSANDTFIQTPTAELDRLFTETLDLASHRIDGWATAFANRRAFLTRDSSFVPRSQSFLGGYAWVENLRPAPRSVVNDPKFGTVEVDPRNGGLIHAPSAQHATAAAVLRNARMSVSRKDSSKYAVDLSSRRVRQAIEITDEIRAGQPLGAVLGYRLERALQDSGVPDLNKLRFVLRNLYPLVANKGRNDAGQVAEDIAARNVVDGLALLTASHGPNFGQTPGLPPPGPLRTRVLAEIAKLDTMIDGVADLFLAESVYQLVRGNVEGALPTLNNLRDGGHLPSPEIAKSPRSGIAVQHRIAYVLPVPPDPFPVPPGWAKKTTPRSAAEPVLDLFVGRVLGNPATVTCTVTFDNPDGTPNETIISVADVMNPRIDLTTGNAIDDTGLRPFDVLALARAVLQPNQGALLDAFVLDAAFANDVDKPGLRIDYDAKGQASDRTFPEIFEVARALGAVLGGARPLAGEDLVSPAEADQGQGSIDVAELKSRADVAVSALGTIRQALADALSSDPLDQAGKLRLALREAALFMPERAFPPTGATGAVLAEVANAVITEIDRRVANLPPLAVGASLKEQAETANLRLKGVFGDDFFVLPRLSAPNPDELAQSIAARSTLLSSDTTPNADFRAPLRFVQQASHARAQLGRFRKFSLYARTLGGKAPRIDVVQLPVVPGERWLGMPFDPDEPPPEGRTSLLLLSQESSLDPRAVLTGILLESWTEIIPSKVQKTAIAFHYDTPRAEAPQAVLVAASPNSNTASWDVEDLIATLAETLDLAKIRTVERDLLAFGQLLPALVLASNPEKVTTETEDIGKEEHPQENRRKYS